MFIIYLKTALNVNCVSHALDITRTQTESTYTNYIAKDTETRITKEQIHSS